MRAQGCARHANVGMNLGVTAGRKFPGARRPAAVAGDTNFMTSMREYPAPEDLATGWTDFRAWPGDTDVMTSVAGATGAPCAL